MIPTILISCFTICGIILSIIFFPNIKIKKIKIQTYWIISLFGAVLLLIFNYAPIEKVSEQLVSSSSINPIKILILFFSMTMLSIFLDEFGLFKYLAYLATKKAKGHQYTLFLILYFLTSLLTVFTSNDVVILTFTPFICMFCKRAKIDPIPYLVSEFVAANTWSLMFLIGNPTNIYLATSAGIDFLSYFKVMAIPTIVAGCVEIIILILLFRKKMKKPLKLSISEYEIENKPLLWIGVIHLVVCLVFLVISSYLNIEMWLVSLITALSLLIFTFFACLITKSHWHDVTKTMERLPYELIPFFLSMFIIVVAINHQGITNHIAAFLGDQNPVVTYGLTSFLSSNIINNIPMSILFSDIASNLTGNAFHEAIFGSIIGSNIGAFLTPIGALAGILFTGLVEQNGVHFSFKTFIKYGSMVSIPVLVSAVGITHLILTI